MGGSATKEVEKDTTNEGNSLRETGGFHVLEIHAPTAGLGLMGVVLLLLAAGAMLAFARWLRRRLAKRQERRRHGFPAMSTGPWPPYPPPTPEAMWPNYWPMFMMLREMQQQDVRLPPVRPLPAPRRTLVAGRRGRESARIDEMVDEEEEADVQGGVQSGATAAAENWARGAAELAAHH